MQVRDAIKARRSIRKFQNKQIPKEKLDKILDSGRLAPSASNRQAWKFVIVQDSVIRKKLAIASRNQIFVGEASAIIIAVSLNPDYVMSCGVPSYAVDISTALDHMMLSAVEEGLGTCWIGAFNQQNVKDILCIPDDYKVVALLPIGYPAENPEPRPRKSLNQIICYEKFSDYI